MLKNNHLKSICYKKVKQKKGGFQDLVVIKVEKLSIRIFSLSTKNNKKEKTMKTYLPENILQIFEKRIRKEAPIISRTKLCKICPFLNPNTLRNQECMLAGVQISEDDNTTFKLNKKVYYTTEDACKYLRRTFLEPQSTIK